MNVINRGVLQGVQEGAFEESVGRQILQGNQFLIHVGQFLLVGQDEVVFVGAGGDLGREVVEFPLGNHGFELE